MKHSRQIVIILLILTWTRPFWEWFTIGA